MKTLLAILLISATIQTCKHPRKVDENALTYLALGDSYTIGESVEQEESFPYQFAAKLNSAGITMADPDIIAVTGWTTNELINAIDQRDIADKQYDIVTLLIGVNNQYRGYSADTYRIEFLQLLNTAISHAKVGKTHVFVISIPDWGVTPFAEGQDRAQIAKEIDKFNAIAKQETVKAGISYIDITPISRQQDTALIAADGLHPSGKMYRLWVDELYRAAEPKIKPAKP